jgi:hypothetical protein
MDECLITGVCCAYCSHFQHPRCPVKTAAPWSKFRQFCADYVPNEHNKVALTLKEGVRQTQEMKTA